MGKLSNLGFVVYDNNINNLYERVYVDGKLDVKASINKFVQSSNRGAEEGIAQICLWVFDAKQRQYFDVSLVRKNLQFNLGEIRDFDRNRIASAYHHWHLKLLGCKTKFEYEQKKESISDELQEIADEDKAWLNRINQINNGEFD